MVEYMIVLAAVIVILLVVLGPSGFFTQKINNSMNEAVKGVACLAAGVCYKPDGCAAVCGNDCCEAGESSASCPADCR